MDVHQLIIIGSGPAGYTAAIYAARAHLAPVLFEGVEPGGQLMTTTEVENFPGFPKGIQGPELMRLFKDQAVRFGTDVKAEEVLGVDVSRRPFVVRTEKGEYQAKAVVIASGASANYLGLPSEEKYKGRGVSACATCDGFFFRGKKVAVVGGGDSAMEEATFLTRFATSVTVLVRSDKLRASPIMEDRAKTNPKINFLFNTGVKEVMGNEKQVTGLRLISTKTNEESDLAVDGMFLAIGHSPNTKIFEGKLEMEKGYLTVKPGSTWTNVEGVFAAGDVADWKYRQAVTAAGTGCAAALDAQRWLEAMEHKK
ncbi:thioredoxin-disulfide reductase [Candidatus Uhrbacteria bacterium]|nr:thioredoxin-disulfide reductase [Candidatus Uhrbacteria bacterium]